MDGVFLGLGSNLGDRWGYLRHALDLIEEKVGRILKKSTIIETEAWGIEDQPDFLNMVIEVDTELSVRDLLSVCQGIENEMERVRGKKWGPRNIDIDILIYGDERINEPDLQVPHPLLWEREFVKRSLMEIAPDLSKEK